MSEVEKMLAVLKQKRDELEVQTRLGSMEAKQQWEELEKQWKDFAAKAEVEKTTEGVSDALNRLGNELKNGYERLKKAL
jgi:vacuolar-type H+-ATPase subunit D/Vma8